MKKLGILVLMMALLTGCTSVSLSQTNRALPLSYVMGDPLAESPVYAENVDCFGVSGSTSLLGVNGKLFSFSFSTTPGKGDVTADYEALKAGLTQLYGKPSNERKDEVVQWSSKKMGTDVTLTSHGTEDAPYVSLCAAGRWSVLCALEMTKVPDVAQFPLGDNLISLLSLTPEVVSEKLGSPTEDKEAGDTSVQVYSDFVYENMSGVVQVSFYKGKSFSASFSVASTNSTCTPDDFFRFYGQLDKAYGGVRQEYHLAYADGTTPSQTHYALWKPAKKDHTAEIMYAASANGDALQFTATANWLLNDKSALDAVLGNTQ